MDTKILNINMINNDISLIKTAAKIVIESGTVAFPTETVYGLGANALNPKAIEKIFTAKGRPSDNPLIVHIDDKNKIQKYVYTNPIAELLMEKFWPGPLTIIFKKKNIIPDIVTSGLDTVAFRIPSHPIALLFLKESNIPIAAPSANISGKPSPTMAKHVVDDLFGKIDAIIDCESSEFGLESTVVDTTSPIPLILRPGTIAYDDLSKYVPDIDFHDSLKSNKVESQPSSPGMKYKHYSPNADLYIFEGEKNDVAKAIIAKYNEFSQMNFKVGILCTDQTISNYEFSNVFSLGDINYMQSIGSNLFKTLRYFDDNNYNIILSESFDKKGIGLTIMNRLLKASGYRIIKV